MKTTTLLLLTVLATSTLTFAQQEATTTEGKKVILNEDGTWKYAETAEPTKTTTTETTAAPKPSGNCDYRTNETDEFTGKKKLVLNKQDLINHTDEELKKYFKKKDYTKAEVYCARVEETKVVYVYWTIQSKEAYKTYGSIQRDSKFMVKLTNGDIVELKFAKYDTGDTKYDYGYTTYSSYCVLDDESIKTLQGSPIEKIRMYWSKGYDEYPVSDANLFINQLPCIE